MSKSLLFLFLMLLSLSAFADEISDAICPAMHTCCKTLSSSPRLRADFAGICKNLIKVERPKLCAIRHHEILDHLKAIDVDIPPACVRPKQECLKVEMLVDANQDRERKCNRDRLRAHLRFVVLANRETLGQGAVVWKKIDRCPKTYYGTQDAINNPFQLNINTVKKGDKYYIKIKSKDITKSRFKSGKVYWDGSILKTLLPEVTMSQQGFKGSFANFSVVDKVKAKTSLVFGFKTRARNSSWFQGRAQIKIVGKGTWYEPHNDSALNQFKACR